MRSKRLGVRLVFAQMMVLACLAGCSGKKHADESAERPDRIAECETYSTALRACVAHLGPSAARLADTHVTYVAEAGANAANDDARIALRDQCIAATKQLSISCR